VADAALLAVHDAAAQLLEADVFLHDRAHHVGAGDEHVAVAGHEDEVGQGRGVDRTAGARPHDDRQLGHDARRLAIGVEDARVAAQAIDALLDARAAAVVDGDERAAVLQGHLHRLDDLVGVHLAQRTAHHGRVLRRGEGPAAVDQPKAGDDAIAQAGAFAAGVGLVAGQNERVDLGERAGVKQQVDAFAGRQPALAVLGGGVFFAAGGRGPARLKVVEIELHIRRFRLCHCCLLRSRPPRARPVLFVWLPLRLSGGGARCSTIAPIVPIVTHSAPRA